MATLTRPVSAAPNSTVRFASVVAGPIVVTSRGDLSSDGAIALALALAAESGCGVQLMGVLEPATMIAPELGAIMDVPDEHAERRAALAAALDAQLVRLGVRPRSVGIDIRVGDPAAVIVRGASDAGARLVVLGATRHDLLERVFGSDTAVRVARSADVPVLVVPRGYGQLPVSAVVAVDFSESSVRAGRAALTLFPNLEAVHLVHVAPHVQPMVELVARWEGSYVANVERAFDDVRDALPVPTGAVIGRQVVTGNPARELLRVATERNADLIVAGSHGHGALQRLFVGSVATSLLRGASVPVLVLPARAGAGIRDPKVQSMHEPSSWPRALDEFSERNAGRRATLEVDDPELGATAQEVDYPFRGCVYDPFDGRLGIMLGDGHPGARHLMRGIGGVAGIDILRDHDGRDRMMRIAHGRRGGRTMLVFTS
jgi:nucleotide-binding universal stress UspA family protein